MMIEVIMLPGTWCIVYVYPYKEEFGLIIIGAYRPLSLFVSVHVCKGVYIYVRQIWILLF